MKGKVFEKITYLNIYYFNKRCHRDFNDYEKKIKDKEV